MSEATQEAPAVPVLGEVVVSTRDLTRCVTWTLGTAAVPRGLTLAGIAAAAAASGRFLGSLSDSDVRAFSGTPGPLQVHIAAHEWLLPLVPGRAEEAEALMISVVNADGSIGPVA